MHDNKTPASGLTREAINHLQDFLVPGGPTEIIVAKGSAGALVAECDPDGLPLQVVEHPGHPDILDLITNPLHDHFLVWERCVILNQPGPEENPRHVAIGIVGLQGIDLFVPPSVFADWFRESMRLDGAGNAASGRLCRRHRSRRGPDSCRNLRRYPGIGQFGCRGSQCHPLPVRTTHRCPDLFGRRGERRQEPGNPRIPFRLIQASRTAEDRPIAGASPAECPVQVCFRAMLPDGPLLARVVDPQYRFPFPLLRRAALAEIHRARPGPGRFPAIIVPVSFHHRCRFTRISRSTV